MKANQKYSNKQIKDRQKDGRKAVKITGLKSVAADLKLIASNYNVGFIYLDTAKNQVYCLEQTNTVAIPSVPDHVYLIRVYNGQIRYGRQDKRPTMAQIKALALDFLNAM